MGSIDSLHKVLAMCWVCSSVALFDVSVGLWPHILSDHATKRIFVTFFQVRCDVYAWYQRPGCNHVCEPTSTHSISRQHTSIPRFVNAHCWHACTNTVAYFPRTRTVQCVNVLVSVHVCMCADHTSSVYEAITCIEIPALKQLSTHLDKHVQHAYVYVTMLLVCWIFRGKLNL